MKTKTPEALEAQAKRVAIRLFDGEGICDYCRRFEIPPIVAMLAVNRRESIREAKIFVRSFGRTCRQFSIR